MEKMEFRNISKVINIKGLTQQVSKELKGGDRGPNEAVRTELLSM